VSGVLDTFADHSLDVPAPINTERHQIPSACGVCHKEKRPSELDAELRKLWPDAARRQARRLRLADAIDEATANASGPALLAVLADRSEAPSLRGTCAMLLAQRFPRQAAAALVPLLAESDSLIRWRAIEALGLAKAREAAGAVATHLTDPALPVRVAAAVTLVSLSDARGEAAVRALTTGADTSALMLPHYALAQLQGRRGELAAAAQSLERAVDRMPYFVDGLIALSEIYRRTGQAELSRSRLEEALAFDPHNRELLERQRLLAPKPPAAP
jgi:HEAT repeat protein